MAVLKLNRLKSLIPLIRMNRMVSNQVSPELEYRGHTPVMLDEVIQYLKPDNKQVIIDMTFGAGGHTKTILDKVNDITVIALDRDPVGYEKACNMSKEYPDRLIPLLGKFSELPDLMKSINMNQNSVDGILFDFGCSSMQFDTAGRGFAISQNGPLDMRMDGERFPDSLTAKDILERATEEDLSRIFRTYGDEKRSKKIARGIVESRYLFRRLETTFELGDLVNAICHDEVRYDKLNRPVHNATKIFQALRIFVNDELNEINQAMHVSQRYLKLGGRLITLCFHSLEDTIVKRHIFGNIIENSANPLPLKYANHAIVHDKMAIDEIMDTSWHSLTKHVIVPSLDEVDKNPRSRSARLRAAVKVK